jgi:hypothetical protein
MTTEEGAEEALPDVDVGRMQRVIQRLRRDTWYWQRVMGVRLTRELSSSAAVQQRLTAWRRLSASTRRRAQNPPHKLQWLCIHRYERDPRQGWSTNTGNGYYGGLQMNLGFQRSYGGWLFHLKGTADHWTALEQMWVAEHAIRAGRGFWPWPNTARYCGIL